MKKYRKRNTYFDSNNSDPNDKYNSNIDTFHNKKIQNYEKYEKVEIPKLEKKLLEFFAIYFLRLTADIPLLSQHFH